MTQMGEFLAGHVLSILLALSAGAWRAVIVTAPLLSTS